MKKTALCLVLVFTLLFSFAGCYKKNAQEKEAASAAVDSNGKVVAVDGTVPVESTTLVINKKVVDQNGEVVTNKKGEEVTETVEISPDDSKGYAEEFSKVIANPEAYNEGDISAILEGVLSADTSGENETVPLALSNKPLVPEGTTKILKENETVTAKTETTTRKKTIGGGGGGGSVPVTPAAPSKTYEEILKGSKYTITGVMSYKEGTDNYSIPFVYAVDGDKYYLKTTVDKSLLNLGIGKTNLTMMFDGANMYMIFGNMGYIKTEPEEGMDTSAMNEMFSIDMFKTGDMIQRSEITFDGKDYICEEYNGEDGGTVKYYKDLSGNLKRIEMAAGSSNSLVDIANVSENVDSKLFNKPSGLDMSDLMNAAYDQ